MMRWQLVGTFGQSGETRNKLIEPIPFRVGRRPKTSLTLPRASISGLHAELFTVDDALYVRDLGSTNGTFINGNRIESEAQLHDGDVLQFADVPLHVRTAQHVSDSCTVPADFCDHALARGQFEKLMREAVVTPYFQPIVELDTDAIVAFEVLARSCLVGLETPGRMFAAAADMQMEAALSDLLRLKGVEASQQFPHVPPIYLNMHPTEFEDGASWDWVARLRAAAPSQRLTIEIHEAAVTDVDQIARFRALLLHHDIALAFDDFGAGQARIAELTHIRPDILKFDRRIISKIDEADAARRRFIECLLDAIRNIGVKPLAEGVETAGELAVCKELGFELAQGYELGRPNPVLVYADWQSPAATSC